MNPAALPGNAGWSCRHNKLIQTVFVSGIALGACSARAQSSDIQIQTPTLPPRGTGSMPSAAAPSSPSYSPSAQAPTYGSAVPPAQPYGPTGTPTPQPGAAMPPVNAPAPYGTPPYGGMPPGGGPGTGSALYPTAPPQAAVPSPMAAQRGSSYGNWGGVMPPQPGAAPVAPLAPQAASTAQGACKPQTSPDRQSITLIGADALPRTHLPLGDFRVQKIVPSPDGTWAVALMKLRGAEEFAAIAIDLNRCKAQGAVSLSAPASDIAFEGDVAIVLLPGAKQRISLAAPGGR
ncbi:MAG TPA: hypothetical protein PLE54_11405 [Burkholderiaceae bacterium]|nr:hypothetical protein [Burkholderiaceae bacterium]